MDAQVLVADAFIEKTICLIRGRKVILDADLAVLYGVSTKRINEQVKRNKARFPQDFLFQLSPEKRAEYKIPAVCIYRTWCNYGSQCFEFSTCD